MGAGLGMAGTAVENPHATWQDYKEGAKQHGIISALGMQAVGTAIHKGVQTVSQEFGVAAKRAAEAEVSTKPEEPTPSTAPESVKDADATKPAAETKGKAPPEEAAPSPHPEPGKPNAQVTPRTAPPPPPAPEAPLPQQTPEAWAAQQKE